MKNIVTVGGGTGSYAVLSGLKSSSDISISALVSMADDGGSTGRLRKKWKVMPAGDVRQCLVALSGKEFLNDRMNTWPWKGHKVGNIFLAVLEKITGDFSTGLEIVSWLLKIKGKIIPVTLDNAILCARLKDSKIIQGESNIDTESLQRENREDLVENIFYKEKVKLNPSAREAILNADYIIIGPGNIYCSIIPNLITEGFRESIKESKAKIIYLMNLTNKQGHTMGWEETKYIDIIEKYLGKRMDFILINKGAFSGEQKAHYTKHGGEEIFISDNLGDPRTMREDLLLNKIFTQNNNDPVQRSLIRHDSQKLADCISKIIGK